MGSSSSERLRLRWNDFESNIKTGFYELRQDGELFDVTIACGTSQIQAHKVILSACSPFFRSIIKSIPHSHPLLYLRGVKFSHLESLLNFMYNGEVNVSQEDLHDFLSVAEELKIKGLIQNNSSFSSSRDTNKSDNSVSKSLSVDSSYSENPSKRIKKIPSSSSSKHFHNNEEENEMERSVKTEPRSFDSTDNMESECPYGEESYNDYAIYGSESGDLYCDSPDDSSLPIPGTSNNSEQNNKDSNFTQIENQISSLIVRSGDTGEYSCLKCNFTRSHHQTVRKHVEGKHLLSRSVVCSVCSRTMKNRNSLAAHMSQNHRTFTRPYVRWK